MKCHKNNDSYQWAKLVEHWGWLLSVIIVFLGMQMFLFFMTLTGTPWIYFLVGSFVLMIFGSALIVYAKLPAYRNGRFFTFGAGSVPEHLVRHYRWGWRLFLTGM